MLCTTQRSHRPRYLRYIGLIKTGHSLGTFSALFCLSPHAQGYPRGSRELLGPLTARFGPREAREWFTSRGVQLKTERDGRVFPTTDRCDQLEQSK
jgi:predicted flavoprotein YhiN